MPEARIFSNSFSSWLYPSRCGLCSVLGEAPICASCLQEFLPADSVRPAFDDGALRLSATLYHYGGRAGQAVRRLKYSRATVLGGPMAALMAEGILRLGLHQYDVVVPIPIHWSRLCSRGFNQAELLCAGLERVDHKALIRVRRTKPQAQLSREARMHNLIGAFRARASVQGKTVLLIDDVLTSGETARECAKALRRAGAKDVAALAFAGEPHPQE
jgi:ComF family protein